MIFELGDAEDKLGYVFRDKMLLRKAFTHSSYINENPGSESNERLEFFGDSILGFVVKEHLFKRFPEKDEGELTEMCQNIVSTDPLAAATRRKGLNACLLLGLGEQKQRENRSICENLFEASVAAIYLDGGLNAARKFILETLAPEIEASLDPEKRTKHSTRAVKAPPKAKAEPPEKKPARAPSEAKPKQNAGKSGETKPKLRKNAEKAADSSAKDAKSRLSEGLQKTGRTHEYRVESRTGPDHDPTFAVRLTVDGKTVFRGTGKNKKAAEMQAAEKAVKKLKL